ncbi:hypothetical protein HNP46_000271 [Pseudomonas nitritireducens]|uniref:Uncharacterized protein n=1 Tax=Pseudomonas nitroreducens TaxID=46680 RepID=A0A7W7KEM9_PSENT|nr:hypothetical protein [Pseudomonas nitritireducens]MBB4861460.1 hypothetical protein [Pseudomonas nitritireducens]
MDKKVPFDTIQDITKDRLLLKDFESGLRARETPEGLTLEVEITRRGADNRRISGYTTLDEQDILRMWAALDRLVRSRGLENQVETQDEYEARKLALQQARERMPRRMP